MPSAVAESLRALLAPLLAAHAPLRPTPLCPELLAFAADDELPLWLALEAAVGHHVDAPFFAVAWPGAQAVARAVLDGLVDVRDRVVVDLGCGSGLASVAAKRCGASHVIAVDIDPFAVATAGVLAQAHDLEIEAVEGSLLDDSIEAIVARADVVLAADLVYNQSLGAALAQRSRAWSSTKQVVLADSGRPFFDAAGLRAVASWVVPVPRFVEGRSERTVVMYRMP
jgi:predicted nicotinamide N-methyase